MTLVVGLKGAAGVVLASDSQGTHGALKQTTPKLFRSAGGLIWGTSGPLAGSQALYSQLEQLDLGPNPSREHAKAGIRKAMLATSHELNVTNNGLEERFEGLFAWYDDSDRRHYLLRARQDGHMEFMPTCGAIGSSEMLGLFGFSRYAFLDYKTVPLETTKMLAYMVAEDAVRASAKGVDLPIQMAVVSKEKTSVLHNEELQLVQDTAAAFQMYQRDFLIRVDDSDSSGHPTGLVPGEDKAG